MDKVLFVGPIAPHTRRRRPAAGDQLVGASLVTGISSHVIAGSSSNLRRFLVDTIDEVLATIIGLSNRCTAELLHKVG